MLLIKSHYGNSLIHLDLIAVGLYVYCVRTGFSINSYAFLLLFLLPFTNFLSFADEINMFIVFIFILQHGQNNGMKNR